MCWIRASNLAARSTASDVIPDAAQPASVLAPICLTRDSLHRALSCICVVLPVDVRGLAAR
eukprot:m.60550 g.60550  ORF g.60550 m.60550 type:complete len:61 (-) comp49361_c0_seq1:27-209(-)